MGRAFLEMVPEKWAVSPKKAAPGVRREVIFSARVEGTAPYCNPSDLDWCVLHTHITLMHLWSGSMSRQADPL